jgi:hypothetical protein
MSINVELGRRSGLFGAALGLSTAYASVQIVNYKYQHSQGLKLSFLKKSDKL